MPRAPRNQLVAPDGRYHVISRGNNKQRIFHDDQDYHEYMRLIGEAKTRHRVFLYHFVLMPNHVHFSLKPEDNQLPLFMHRLQYLYARYYCEKYEFVGHLWQGRYKSLLLNSDQYVFACGNYIELNPVRAGIVQNPEHWPYSSYRVYAFGEKSAIVEVDPFYETFGGTKAERQTRYRSYIVQTIER